MLVAVIGKSGSGKTYFTNHLLYNMVEGLGGAIGTTRYVENDVSSKDLTDQVLAKLSRKENVILELQSLIHLNPVLRKNVSCYVFTSSVDSYLRDDVVFPEKLRQIVDLTFDGVYMSRVYGEVSVEQYSRVVFNRRKNMVTVQTDYKL